MKTRRIPSPSSFFFVSVVLLTVLGAASSPRLMRSALAQTSPSQFRVIQSVCGSKGELHGTDFVMEDTRTIFHVPQDHQIIISFEWEGPPGSHHAVGTWRSPDGKVALTSDFELHSDGTKYVGTWTLAIPATIAPGLWALEAQIDGTPAGTQIFQIVSDEPKPAPAPPPMPAPAEIYQRAASSTVSVTSLDQNGSPITRGLAFFIGNGSVLTAFQAIDGASSVELDLADGTSTSVANVSAWNRRQDWAILKLDSANGKLLDRAAPGSWKVGDLCYVLTSQGPASRTIETVNITGFQGTGTEQRLTVSQLGQETWLGAPVLDLQGRVIGILSGGVQGVGSRRMGSWATYLDLGQAEGTLNPTVLPLSAISATASSQPPTTFAELAAQGFLTIPLALSPQAATGTLCSDFRTFNGQVIEPVQPGNKFVRAQGKFSVVITWGPSEKIHSLAQLRIYDLGNHPVLQTVPSKIKLEPHVTMYSAWRIPIASLQPGIYRIDLLLADQPQWRSFFRISD